MLLCRCNVKSISPYSQSRPIQTPKNKGETDDAHDTRVWREHLHATPDGEVFIPPMAFKNCLAEAAKFKSEKIPGKRNATYTKHFEVGTMFADPILLGIHVDDVLPERLFLNSDGIRGGGRRVWKTYPLIPEWEAAISFYLVDDTLIQDPAKVFEYMQYAGRIIGIGRFRPRNNGFYGRFTADGWKVSEAE